MYMFVGVVQWVMSNCVLTWSCHIASSTRPFLIVFVINYVVRMLFIHFLCCSSDCAAYSALLAIFLLSQPTPPCGWDVSYSLIINHYSCTTHCHGAQEQGFVVLCFLNYITSHCSGLTHCRDYPGEGICGGFVVLCFLNHITKSLLWHNPLSWRPKIIQISLW